MKNPLSLSRKPQGPARRTGTASRGPKGSDAGAAVQAGPSQRRIAAAAIWLACAAAACAAAPDPGVLTLALDRGVEDGSAMVLDVSVRAGRIGKDVWGAAYGYNLNQHTGTVEVSESAAGVFRMSVKLPIEGDPVAPGGLATYDLAVARRGDEWTGTYTGFFNDVAVTGAVAGRVTAPGIREIPGVEPLQPGEHPRLIFRKSDGPVLKRRMETPEGKAILAMLNEKSPLRDVSQVSDRHVSWMAANWGAVYRLTGDTNAAQRARDILMSYVVTAPMPWDRKDIHHAPRLLGVALTYDLCYDAWDDTFRRLLGEYIRVAASELSRGMYEGFAMDDKTWDPAPWGHRNAIRMSCAGVAALAILGDPDTAGKPLPDAERILRVADRHVEQYLRLGVSQAGTGLEGDLPRDLALANGLLQFLHASRVARGRDFSGVNPMVIAGNILACRPSSNACDFALSSISVQASGLWPIGLGAVKPEWLPALKWCFDRDAGLQGKQHFGCAYPYQAAYALKNYPFDVEARPPGEVLPLFAADSANGHFVLRNRWQDADDAIVELFANARGLPPPKGKEDALSAGVFTVSGLGGVWLRGFAGVSRVNDKAGADILYAENDGRQTFVGMDLSGLYRPAPPKVKVRGGMTRDFKPIVKTQWQKDAIQEFLKTPVREKVPSGPKVAGAESTNRMIRHVAADLSGACGAPVLLAMVERSSDATPTRWRVPVPNLVPSADGFTAGDANGANLAGRIVAPGGARVQAGQIAGKGEYFLVMTLQQGAAPAARIEGTGLDARVVLGGRAVSFNGRRIVFGDAR
jgi:hypothetical protein